MQDSTLSRLSGQELTEQLAAEFPGAFNEASGLSIETVAFGGCRIRQRVVNALRTSSGAVSRPVIMQLADISAHGALLSAVDWAPLAVTTK